MRKERKTRAWKKEKRKRDQVINFFSSFFSFCLFFEFFAPIWIYSYIFGDSNVYDRSESCFFSMSLG